MCKISGMHRSARQHLLHVVAIALLALQWSAATHAADHVLEPVHDLCALCHIGQSMADGPATPMLLSQAAPTACLTERSHAEPIAEIAWASLAVRAPPITA